MNKKIGLLLGSFDPIHNGHVTMAAAATNLGLVDKVFFVPSAQNPWKAKSTNFMIRCAMIQRAIEGESEFFLSPVELELEAPYYTYKTLELLQKQYPQDEFSLIVGSDVALSIKDWEKGDWILQNFPLITVNRPGCDEPGIVDIPLEMNTSSTLIRAKVKNGESIVDLVPPGVDEIIECIKLYKNE